RLAGCRENACLRGVALADPGRPPEMPIRCLLIGPRKYEHLTLTKELANEGKAGRISFLIKAVRKNHAWMSSQVGDRSIQGCHRVRRVVCVVKRDQVNVNF